MLNFTYEGDIRIENKYHAGISRTLYLFTETISRPPQSREIIPFNSLYLGINFVTGGIHPSLRLKGQDVGCFSTYEEKKESEINHLNL
jgi:hypothetical protein